ncbi:MAG: hypothetical protein LC646_04310 [Xanthomonadaceae bacterium]|nr:hypothetical protein [Xanthomonadaceae bacterium]
MVLCVPAEQADRALDRLKELGEDAWRLGHIEAGEGAAQVRFTER